MIDIDAIRERDEHSVEMWKAIGLSPMAPSHQDCHDLLAEVDALKAELAEAREERSPGAWDIAYTKGEVKAERQRCVDVLTEIKAKYPMSVFPEPYKGCVPDLYSAAGCRLVCDNAIAAIEEPTP